MGTTEFKLCWGLPCNEIAFEEDLSFEHSSELTVKIISELCLSIIDEK